jgi:hypothetical protein
VVSQSLAEDSFLLSLCPHQQTGSANFTVVVGPESVMVQFDRSRNSIRAHAILNQSGAATGRRPYMAIDVPVTKC